MEYDTKRKNYTQCLVDADPLNAVIGSEKAPVEDIGLAEDDIVLVELPKE